MNRANTPASLPMFPDMAASRRSYSIYSRHYTPKEKRRLGSPDACLKHEILHLRVLVDRLSNTLWEVAEFNEEALAVVRLINTLCSTIGRLTGILSSSSARKEEYINDLDHAVQLRLPLGWEGGP